MDIFANVVEKDTLFTLRAFCAGNLRSNRFQTPLNGLKSAT